MFMCLFLAWQKAGNSKVSDKSPERRLQPPKWGSPKPLLRGQILYTAPHPWKYPSRGGGHIKEGGGCRIPAAGASKYAPPPLPKKSLLGQKWVRGGGYNISLEPHLRPGYLKMAFFSARSRLDGAFRVETALRKGSENWHVECEPHCEIPFQLSPFAMFLSRASWESKRSPASEENTWFSDFASVFGRFRLLGFLGFGAQGRKFVNRPGRGPKKFRKCPPAGTGTKNKFLGAKSTYPHPRPPLKYFYGWGLHKKEGVGIKFLPRKGFKIYPPPPPEKCLLARRGGVSLTRKLKWN